MPGSAITVAFIAVLSTVACSGPNVEATVEARLAQERAIEATVEARLKTALPTQGLITAIDTENTESVKEILGAGINPNKNPVPVGFPLTGAYPLHLAVVKGNKEIVQILLDNGAKIDIKAKNKDEATPLAWAAFLGQKDAVSLLIEAGAPINPIDANQYTPLDAAGIAWRASQDNAAWAKNLMEIMTIIKANGGKHADEL